MKKIRLCSSSPTRAKILREYNISFIQNRVNFDEDIINCREPKAFVYYVSLGKLKMAQEIFSEEIPILCADSVVVCENRILRKAKSVNEAKELLLLQSGNRVKIITAIHLKSKAFYFVDISSTEFYLKKFDEEDLQRYLLSESWQGKAGACMIEGFCKKYIKSMSGLKSTAMGLQIEKILPWIGE